MLIRQFERGLEPRRAVEVISTKDNSTNIYGSGYRVGGWLVLTAAHLVNCVGTDFIPHKLEEFLALSTKLLLLKRFGGSYTFFHPLLQKHFLETSVDQMNSEPGN